MLCPRYWGRKPNRTTRPVPSLASTRAARPATRSGCNTHPDNSTLSASAGYRATTRAALESSTSNAGPLSYHATDWAGMPRAIGSRSEEHTSELQSRLHLVCRLLLEKKKKTHLTIDC